MDDSTPGDEVAARTGEMLVGRAVLTEGEEAQLRCRRPSLFLLVVLSSGDQIEGSCSCRLVDWLLVGLSFIRDGWLIVGWLIGWLIG